MQPARLANLASVFLVVAVIGGGQPSLGADFHAAPDGTADGDGSAEMPWNLAAALAPPAAVRPGDTIWLKGGTYVGGFESRLTGTPEAPITVRGMPGERVTIDARPRDERDNALFLLAGADTVYRDFEVTCSDPKRVTEINGSWPEDIRRGNIDMRGDRIAVVNIVAHDLASGFGCWSEGEGGEVSGCLIYNCGWQGPDRGHGHAIYAQNARGTKRLADNIVFHQFGYGIHCYGSEKASLEGFEIEGNIAFHNGCLARDGGGAPGVMVGGGCPVARAAVRDNVIVGGGIRLGYPWGTISEDVICTGNYCEGLVLRDFRRATVEHNTIVAHSSAVILEGADRLLLSGLNWNENELYITDGRWGDTAIVEEGQSRGLTIDEWRTQTGCDLNSTFSKGTPTEPRVIVRPNIHEPGRAHIAVLNPAGLAEVEVDLSHVLQDGQAYRIVSAKDFHGADITAGTFDGQPVRLSMKPISPPPPVGLPDAELPITEPHFGAFVVLPVEGKFP